MLLNTAFLMCFGCQAGDIKLVIAAKVDVRDGVAWSSLDKYIKNIEGTAAGTSALQSHSSEPEAAGPVTAANDDEDADALSGMWPCNKPEGACKRFAPLLLWIGFTRLLLLDWFVRISL